MELAFCSYIGKHSKLVAVLLRAIRGMCWPLVVARFSFGTRMMAGDGSTSPVSVTFVAMCLLLATVDDAVTARILLDRRTLPALHESRKVCNFVWLLIMRMLAAVFVAPAGVPIFSAPWIALYGAVDILADQLRLTVALHMLALSCLAAGIVQVGQAAPPLAAAHGAALIAVFGFLLPAAAVVCLELRSRLRFLELHSAGAETLLPPFWAAATAALGRPTTTASPCQVEPAAAAGQLQQPQMKQQTKPSLQSKAGTYAADSAVASSARNAVHMCTQAHPPRCA